MGFSVHLGSKSNNFAELYAVFFGIQAALDAGFPLRHLWLESDSSFVVNCLLGATSVGVQFQALVERILSLLDGKQWKISHIPREGNRAADRLANFGLSITGERVFLFPPTWLQSIVSEEASGMPQYRFK